MNNQTVFRLQIDEEFAAVYKELKPLAAQLLSRQRQSTLTPTALINEAYVRLASSQARLEGDASLHFRRLVATVMKRVLTDAWRRRNSLKRGDGANRVTIDDQLEAKKSTHEHILALHEVIDQLRVQDSRKADIVEWRFYFGLSDREIASELGISVATVERDWQFSRAWLYACLKDCPAGNIL